MTKDSERPHPFGGYRASYDDLRRARVKDDRRSSNADGEPGRQAGSGSPTQVRR
jgi:hypothetical protein